MWSETLMILPGEVFMSFLGKPKKRGYESIRSQTDEGRESRDWIHLFLIQIRSGIPAVSDGHAISSSHGGQRQK